MKGCGRHTEIRMASTVLLLCLTAVIALAACGEEQQATPAADAPVPSEPTIVSAPTATVSAAAEPQLTATVAPADTPVPVPTPTPTPKATAESPPAAAHEPTTAPTSPETDREALVALYNATDGPNWNRNDIWLSDVPISQWEGVTTDNNSRVTELFLRENQLTGEIPSALSSLASWHFWASARTS